MSVNVRFSMTTELVTGSSSSERYGANKELGLNVLGIHEAC